MCRPPRSGFSCGEACLCTTCCLTASSGILRPIISMWMTTRTGTRQQQSRNLLRQRKQRNQMPRRRLCNHNNTSLSSRSTEYTYRPSHTILLALVSRFCPLFRYCNVISDLQHLSIPVYPFIDLLLRSPPFTTVFGIYRTFSPSVPLVYHQGFSDRKEKGSSCCTLLAQFRPKTGHI